MWSMLEYFPERFLINIHDVGAALSERPPYQSLVDAGRARIMGFEPDAQECGRIDRAYGEPHHFSPHFIGDGNPATFHEINWDLTGSLFPPNTSLLEKFQNLAEVVTPVATHDVSTMRLDALPTIKLQKCAVLAHDLLMSFDLAHLVFSALDRRNGCNLSPV